ncbi:hypothetical protein Hypma_002990 [Hypsizygus marmoreus]|uniref:Uncharacterized protein n=1 Tax=Hypsizygus marmoreus TaxID=39966 RepID=A0A369J2Q5_HYPMA|nr:hypothetical protein Hypma_002990 [Hypsizygus marmoreus]
MFAKFKACLYTTLIVSPLFSPGELCNFATGPDLPGHYELSPDELQDLADGKYSLNRDELKVAFYRTKLMLPGRLRLALATSRAFFSPPSRVPTGEVSIRHESHPSNQLKQYVDAAAQTVRHNGRFKNLRNHAHFEIAHYPTELLSSPQNTPLRDMAAPQVPPPSPSSSFETLAKSVSASSSGSDSSVFGGRRALSTVKQDEPEYGLAADAAKLKKAVYGILVNPAGGLVSPPITPPHASVLEGTGTAVLPMDADDQKLAKDTGDGTLVEDPDNLKLLSKTSSEDLGLKNSRSDVPPSSSPHCKGQQYVNPALRKVLNAAAYVFVPGRASRMPGLSPMTTVARATSHRTRITDGHNHTTVTSTTSTPSGHPPPRRTTHFQASTRPGTTSFRTDWQKFKQELYIDPEHAPMTLAIISVYLIFALSLPLQAFISFVLGTCPPIAVGLVVAKGRRLETARATRAWQRQAFVPHSKQDAYESCCTDMNWESPLLTSTPKIAVHFSPRSRVPSEMQEDSYLSDGGSESEDELDTLGRGSVLLVNRDWKGLLRVYRTLNRISMRTPRGRRALPRSSSVAESSANGKVLASGKQCTSGMRKIRRSGTQPHHDLKTLRRSGIGL